MDEPESSKARVLVKDGKWAVPVEERPKNWREILPESEAEPPILEKILAKEVEPQTEPIPLPDVTPTAKAPKPPYEPWNDPAWIKVKDAVNESAQWFGAEPQHLDAALVLVAGMWTRTHPVIKRMTGVTNPKPITARCYELQLWNHDDKGVVLDGEDEDTSDLELWLLAMTICGEFERLKSGEYRVAQVVGSFAQRQMDRLRPHRPRRELDVG